MQALSLSVGRPAPNRLTICSRNLGAMGWRPMCFPDFVPCKRARSIPAFGALPMVVVYGVTIFALYCIATFKHTHRADLEFYQILLQNYYILGTSGLLKGRRLLTGRRTMQVKGIGRIE